MAITEQAPYNNATGNGSTTVFAYTFKLFAASDLKVYLDGVLKTITTDYTISGVGDESGGSVTFLTAPAASVDVMLVRSIPYDRLVDYQTSGDLLADTLDADLDRIESQIQQLSALNGVTLQSTLPLADYDAHGREIINLGSPTTGGSAVNRTYLDAALAGYPDNPTFITSIVHITVDTTITDAVIILPGGMFTISSGVTLTINAPFQAGLYQVFTGDGSVAFGSGSVSEVYPEWWGAKGNGLTDNTNAYAKLVSAAPDNAKVVFASSGVYMGCFVSAKPLSIEGNGCTMKPSTSDDVTATIYFEGSWSLATTLTADTAYGDISITVADALGLAVGDLIVLIDDTTRPYDATPGINVEMLQIKSIDGTTVYVDDMVRSIQSTGTKRVYRITPLGNPAVKNVNVDASGTSTAPSVYFRYCFAPKTDNIEVTNFVGNAIRFEYCWNPVANNSRPLIPKAVGSGEGYGVVSLNCRLSRFTGVYARGTRHPVDISSSYDVIASDISDPEGVGGGLVECAHNTFGGLITIEKVRVQNDGYAVQWSSQGVSTAPNYIIRDLIIRDVEHVIPTLKTDESNASVYLQCAVANVTVDGVKVYYKDVSATPTSNSYVVRLNGMTNGPCSIRNISANEVGNIVGVLISTASPPFTDDTLILDNLSAGNCYCVANIYSQIATSIDNVKCATVESDAAILLTASGSRTPSRLFIGDHFYTSSTKLVVKRTNFSTLLEGKLPALKRVLSVLSLAAGGVVPELNVQQGGGCLQLYSSGSGDITLNATTTFPLATHYGQEITLIQPASSRGAVIIPAASDTVLTNGVNITISKLKTYKMIAIDSAKWVFQGL